MTNNLDIIYNGELDDAEEPIEKEIAQLYTTELSYNQFFQEFLLKNKPAILKNVATTWISSKNWIKDNTLNVNYLKENYGASKVPISNCGKRIYNVQEKSDILMKDYLAYWEQYKKKSASLECLYLKDWHFTRNFPTHNLYTVPPYFASDWLNEYYDKNAHLKDDYRFVYIGPKGSWTPFHVDVFTSFSWSANICGRKKWVLFPPGKEDYFKDELGNIKYDIGRDHELFSKNFGYEIIQENGDAIFIPSGWYHQVWNLEDTVSINHNWINGCNIHSMWKSLKENLTQVKKEISDCKGMDNWEHQCQIVLAASFGFDYCKFYTFLHQLAQERVSRLSRKEPLTVYGNWSFGRNHMLFDLQRIFSVMRSLVHDPDFQELNIDNKNHIQFLDMLENFISSEA